MCVCVCVSGEFGVTEMGCHEKMTSRRKVAILYVTSSENSHHDHKPTVRRILRSLLRIPDSSSPRSWTLHMKKRNYIFISTHPRPSDPLFDWIRSISFTKSNFKCFHKAICTTTLKTASTLIPTRLRAAASIATTARLTTTDE